MNTSEAINKLKSGSKDALKHIVYEYSDLLIKVASRYTRDLEEAKDVLQDSFISIYENINQFNGDDKNNFLKWCRKIVVRLALRKYQRKYYTNEKEELDYNNHPVTEPDVYSTLGSNEIMREIEKLPNGYKMIFKLYVFEDLSHKEIAELLGIKESTSRSQYVRARKFLQNKITRNDKIIL